MKRKIKLTLTLVIFLILFAGLGSSNFVMAQTSTSAGTTDAEKLKDKIASKVAELTITLKIVKRGKIKSIDAENKTLKIVALDNTYTVIYSSKTNYFWIKDDNKSKLTLQFGNLELDDEIVVLGDYIKDINQITAETIYGKTFPRLFVGKITVFDKDNVEIKTLSSNTKYSIDFKNIDQVKVLSKKNEAFEQTANLIKDDLIVVYGIVKNLKLANVTAIDAALIQN